MGDSLRVFRVDDGAIYHVLAVDHADARAVWVETLIASGCAATEADALRDYDEPEITVVQPTDAAGVRVMSPDKEDNCPNCGGRGKVAHYDSLLDIARGGERGAVCCSEWP